MQSKRNREKELESYCAEVQRRFLASGYKTTPCSIMHLKMCFDSDVLPGDVVANWSMQNADPTGRYT